MTKNENASDASICPPEDAEHNTAQNPKISGTTSEEGGHGACPIVVGIGASAGGLSAFEAFFSSMPVDLPTPMAFVLVQHLAPDHKSILSELVRRYTQMRVFEVQDGIKVEPNCAYIIPPNYNMAFLNGALRLFDPVEPRGQRMPIDFFFRSLAQDQRERAICVVLSGTGSDGTMGLRAIKGEGGMAMAQSPESTQYDGMPSSAIATGLVDFVLQPSEMPAQLIRYVGHAFGKIPRPLSPSASKAGDTLQKIFVLLRSQTGHDFSHYKAKTIHRRVERRMAVHQIEHPDLYLRFLQQTPTEIEALFRDLLIGVTHFFRDPHAFRSLEEQAIPRILAGKSPGAFIRIWVPGCSTGEEAYSIAILLQEQVESLKQSFRIQIFATDIDSRAVETARSGIYPASIASDISPERLSRFFAQEPGGGAFRIRKSIRDMLIFSEQDLLRDPPFSKLDLISCRNLLIYLDTELQKKLIPLFHYALNASGLLFLGTSETVGEFTDHFSTLDRNAKLYLRKAYGGEPLHPTAPTFIQRPFEEVSSPRISGKIIAEQKPPLRELSERVLLQNFTPAAALINERGDILYLHGRTGRYLEPAPGEANMNILKMAREGLLRELQTALRHVVTQKTPAYHPGLLVKTNGEFTPLNLRIRPVAPTTDAGAESGLFLVVFEEIGESFIPPAAADASQTPNSIRAEGDARLNILQRELKAKEEHLQCVNEELETTNEELKSYNEEMQSINEEMQSANEELETSKEELQSVNEELATVNAELQTKVADLSRTNNDMNNLMAGIGIGTIFVDMQLRILRFTSAVTQVINLIPSDVGRPLGHIVSNLKGYDRLMEDVRSVLNSLVPQEIEVQTQSGAWYNLRIRPYRTLENMIEGALITFSEISEIKRAQESIRQGEELRKLAAVVLDADDPVVVQDLEGKILVWNAAAQRMYGFEESLALTMNFKDLIPAQSREEVVASIKRLVQHKTLFPFQIQRLGKDGRIVDTWLSATALLNKSGDVYAIATLETRVEEAKDKGHGGQ